MSRSSNAPAVPAASSALNKFKMEVASELGLSNYDSIDKGQLSSRQNGYVGGNMTKKMVAFAEQALAQGQSSSIANASPTISSSSSGSSSSSSSSSYGSY
jgi:hypothetical protein